MKNMSLLSKLKTISECKGRFKEIVGEEGIMALAKDGICPHYILKNPITGEESYWFIPSEINDWMEANYVRYIEGHYTPEYKFIIFNEQRAETKETPIELSGIRDLFELPVMSIYTPPGVYFLCKESKIQYVGQAVNVSSRVIQHLNEGRIAFDKAYFITCPINRLNVLEAALIKYLKPPLNQTNNKNMVDHHILVAESVLKCEVLTPIERK